MKRGTVIIIILANAFLVLAIVGGLVAKKQAIVDSGTTVYLKLAPVDPRSLMQGDYMVLRYAVANSKSLKQAMADRGTRGVLLLEKDERGVGTFLAPDASAGGADEGVPLAYRKWRRGWRFGIESFFFQEGHAEIYEDAKFAEIRVANDGEAVLVGLCNDELAPLGPPAG